MLRKFHILTFVRSFKKLHLRSKLKKIYSWNTLRICFHFALRWAQGPLMHISYISLWSEISVRHCLMTNGHCSKTSIRWQEATIFSFCLYQCNKQKNSWNGPKPGLKLKLLLQSPGLSSYQSLGPLLHKPATVGGQSDKHFTLLNYASRVVLTRKLPVYYDSRVVIFGCKMLCRIDHWARKYWARSTFWISSWNLF